MLPESLGQSIVEFHERVTRHGMKLGHERIMVDVVERGEHLDRSSPFLRDARRHRRDAHRP